MAEGEARGRTETAITAYGIFLTPVDSFIYIGRFLLVLYSDWTTVVLNLHREQQKWAQLSRVLGKEGTDARTVGRIYMAVVQVVILYG